MPLNHPPHHHHRDSGRKAFVSGLSLSAVIAASFGLGLLQLGIQKEVVLPTTAPIFVGFATMLFMVFKE